MNKDEMAIKVSKRIKAIKAVEAAIGTKVRSKVADELNNREIWNLEENPWKTQTLTNFINRYREAYQGESLQQADTHESDSVTHTPETGPEQDAALQSHTSELTETSGADVLPEVTESYTQGVSHIEPQRLAPEQREDVVIQETPESYSGDFEPDVIHKQDNVGQSTVSHTESQSMTPEEPQEPVIQQEHTVLQLPPETVQDLLIMLTWWKEHGKGIDMQAATPVQKRPNFKRGSSKDTGTKTVRLSKGLIRDAERYAKRHTWTGGTFNGLVELLIWEALGRPEKHIIPESDDSNTNNNN